MVIHIDSEAPVEISFRKKPTKMESSHIYAKNHEIELNKTNPVLKRMSSKKMKNSNPCSSSSDTDSEENIPSTSEISAEDLNELKTVYQQCKAVMKKIELKYGHLMSLDTAESAALSSTIESSRKRRKMTQDDILEEPVCQCTMNKKIVFDDEGKEVMIDALPSNHICPKKLMSLGNQNTVPQFESRNIQIEYHGNDVELTDDLQELQSILRNAEIETPYRNLVINKVRAMKLEHSNELKFNKHSLIEKVKSNPDEVFSFKGSNLSALTGYF